MEHLLNLLFLSIITCFIVDISGFIDTIKTTLSKILTKNKINTSNFRLRPFDCSLCCVWWICLGYLIYAHIFTIPYIAFVAVLSLCSKNITGILIFWGDLITSVINWADSHL